MRILCCLVLLALATVPALAVPSDDQARRLIVGDWIAAPAKSGSLQEALYRALARYNPDGTGHVRVFSDAACSKLAFTRSFRWMIARGQVVTVVPDGRRIADEIVSLDSQSMTLRLAGRLEHRIRAATCARQMAV